MLTTFLPFSIAPVAEAEGTGPNLAGLTLSPGSLSPAFDPEITAYTAGTVYDSSLSVTPTLSDTVYGTVYVNGSLTASGYPFGPISLNAGLNTIFIQVYAQDNSSKTYTIAVNREQAPATVNAAVYNGILSEMGLVGLPAFGLTPVTIRVTLNNDTFKSAVSASDFALNNGPSILISNVYRQNDGVADLTLGYAYPRTDFDSDITDFRIVVMGSGLNKGVTAVSNTLTITAADATISPGLPDQQATNAFGPVSSVTGAKLYVIKPVHGGGNMVTLGCVTNLRAIQNTGILNQDINNFKLFSDLDHDSVCDPNEQITADGAGGTIRNGSSISVSKQGNPGDPFTQITTSGLNNSPVSWGRDLMVQADVTNLVPGDRLQLESGVADIVYYREYGTTNNSVRVLDGPTVIGPLHLAASAANSNAELANLTLSQGNLSPAFDPQITSYTAGAVYDSSLSITPTLSDTVYGTVYVNGSLAVSGYPFGPISLNTGSNTLTIQVYAQDNSNKVYTVTVTRAESPVSVNAAVYSGILSEWGLVGSPVYGLTPVTLRVTLSNEVFKSSLSASDFALNNAPNIVISNVYRQNDSMADITLNYAYPRSDFDSDITDFRVVVMDSGLSKGVAAVSNNLTIAAVDATISTGLPNYQAIDAFGPVTGVTGAKLIAFKKVHGGGDIAILGHVGTLRAVQNTGILNGDITNFKLFCDLDADGVCDPNEQITSDGAGGTLRNGSLITVSKLGNEGDPFTQITTSGVNSSPGYWGYDLMIQADVANLVPGDRLQFESAVSDIVYCREYGTTNNSVRVVPGPTIVGPVHLTTGIASSNADLANLSVSQGALNPAFDPAITAYTVGVSYSVNSLTVTPSLSDAVYGNVFINGSPAVNAAPFGPIGLNPGTNTIQALVYAQDNTSKTYTLTVNRATVNNNADLSNLTLSQGTLNPAFDPGVTSYTTDVPYIASSLKVTPTLSDAVYGKVYVNGRLTTSGVPSSPISLIVGTNMIRAVVYAQDSTAKAYWMTVNRTAPSANTDLTNFTLSQGVLNPEFSSGVTDYTTSVPYPINSLKATPTLADAVYGKVYINGRLTVSGNPSSSISLAVGTNTIRAVVYAQNGNTKTYTTSVNRENAINVNLSNLWLSQCALSPSFDTAITSYTATVPFTAASLTITPVITDTVYGKVLINGRQTASGSASVPINLAIGTNAITCTVYSQDGSVKSYTIIVTRTAASRETSLSSLTVSQGGLSPSFDPGITIYTVTVPYVVTSLTATPTLTDAVYGKLLINGRTAASGSPSLPISLAVGTNIINCTAYAQDGSARAYAVIVTREAARNDADLSSLTLSHGDLSPAFDPANTSYSVSVPYAASSLTVTPTLNNPEFGKILVNGRATVSGSPSALISLAVGSNVITCTAYSQDGSAKAYTISVTRTPA